MESREAAGSLLNPLLPDPFLGLTTPSFGSWLPAQAPVAETQQRPSSINPSSSELSFISPESRSEHASASLLPSLSGESGFRLDELPSSVLILPTFTPFTPPTSVSKESPTTPTPDVPAPLAPPTIPAPPSTSSSGEDGFSPGIRFKPKGGPQLLSAESNLPLVSVNAYDPEAAEMAVEPGPSTGLYEFTRTGDTTDPLLVTFAVEGTATFQADYEGWDASTMTTGTFEGRPALIGQVKIAAEMQSKTVKMTVLDDTAHELTEDIKVSVIAVPNVYDVPPDQIPAVVSIADNDPPPLPPQVIWIGRVDETAQEDYEFTNQWNTGKVELMRSDPTNKLDVNFSVTGSATLNADYGLWGPVAGGYGGQITETKLSTSGKVTFAAGQDRLWVRVDPLWNGGDAEAESIVFTVTSGTGYAIDEPHDGTVTIYGDRAPSGSVQPNPYGDYSGSPLLDVFITTGTEGKSTGDASASEYGPDSGSFLITYQHYTSDPGFIPPDSPSPAWILGGTATAGADYDIQITREVTARIDEVIVLPTQTVYRISAVHRVVVIPLPDAESEGNETVDITVPRSAGASGGLIGEATITIADSPRVWVEAPDEFATEQDLSTGSFRIMRAGPNIAQSLTVQFKLGGTATYAAAANNDYTLANNGGSFTVLNTSTLTGEATFAAGQRMMEIKLTPVDDTLKEGYETAMLSLLSGTGYNPGTPTSATVGIWSDDEPSVSVSAAGEADEEGSVPGTFTFTRRGGDTGSPLTAWVGWGDGTELGDIIVLADVVDDFTPTKLVADSSGPGGYRLTFPAGVTVVEVQVIPVDDKLPEGGEAVIARVMSDPAGQYEPDRRWPDATLALLSNDAGVWIDAGGVDREGDSGSDAEIVVQRLNSTTSLSVNLTLSGTATEGADYLTLPHTVVFQPGQTVVRIPVQPTDDGASESDETVVATLVPAAGWQILGDSSAAVTIRDNEVAARDDSAGYDPNAPLTIDALANDSAGLSVANYSQPASGSVTWSGGKFVYTPPQNGPDAAQFTYTVSDVLGRLATATVLISANQPAAGVEIKATGGTGVTIADSTFDFNGGKATVTVKKDVEFHVNNKKDDDTWMLLSFTATANLPKDTNWFQMTRTRFFDAAGKEAGDVESTYSVIVGDKKIARYGSEWYVDTYELPEAKRPPYYTSREGDRNFYRKDKELTMGDAPNPVGDAERKLQNPKWTKRVSEFYSYIVVEGKPLYEVKWSREAVFANGKWTYQYKDVSGKKSPSLQPNPDAKGSLLLGYKIEEDNKGIGDAIHHQNPIPKNNR